MRLIGRQLARQERDAQQKVDGSLHSDRMIDSPPASNHYWFEPAKATRKQPKW